ncbi:MAG: hypothetical protein Q7T55_22755 [Solirubrobacteraceae bacterium]|nr:hypothetical protein [Solirubrobacteraceae bacterium]
MGDRIRIGELLAAIGTIVLIVSLVALDWFEGKLGFPSNVALLPGDAGAITPVGLDAGALGWFAFATLIVTILSSIVFFLRALTARGPERPMLQGPIAYTIAGFTFLVILVRVLIFQPGSSPDALSGDVLLPAELVKVATVDISVELGGYLGLLAVFLIVIGLWIALGDERTGSAAAKAHTAALLAASPVRPVPVAVSAPNPDASVVADDAIPTDPSSPADPASGGPA